MTYKAGTAFITVAPSFDNFQAAVEKEVRKLGAFHVKLYVDLDVAAAETQLTALSAPRKVKIDVEVDAKQAQAEIDKLDRKHPTVHVDVEVDEKEAEKNIGHFARTF